MPGGRPTALTPEVARAIVEALRVGNYIGTACNIAGVAEKSFYNWVERGKAGESPFSEFLQRCEKAIAEAETSAIKSIQGAGKRNWQALAWWLERRHRKRWAKNTDLGIATSTPGTSKPDGVNWSKPETPPSET